MFLVDNPYQPSPTPDLPPILRRLLHVSPNAIDFTLSDLDGNQYSLSEFRGKPVLVAFLVFYVPIAVMKCLESKISI